MFTVLATSGDDARNVLRQCALSDDMNGAMPGACEFLGLFASIHDGQRAPASKRASTGVYSRLVPSKSSEYQPYVGITMTSPKRVGVHLTSKDVHTSISFTSLPSESHAYQGLSFVPGDDDDAHFSAFDVQSS